MAKRVDPAKTAQKWGRVTPGRRQDYEDGVQHPTQSWQEKTLAARQAYNDGVQAAIAEDRFSAGVASTSDEEWKKKTLEKGPGRWAAGVAMSQDAYAKGFAPYAETLNNLTLPPRGPKGDPRNLERVAAVDRALRQKKEELMGS